LHPLEKRRLVTAHVEIRHSFRRPEAAIRATAGEPSGYGLFRRTARRKIREYAPLGTTVVAVQA
jgi:hypothetical protein